MPAPPTPGGSSLTEWWRIVGLIVITVLTTGIFALIFRASISQPNAEEKGDSTQDPDLADAPVPGITPFRRAGDPIPAAVIPFPARNKERANAESIDFTAAAASERLRRRARTDRSDGSRESLDRRRLGTRRVVGPATGSGSTVESSDLPADVKPIPVDQSTELEPPVTIGDDVVLGKEEMAAVIVDDSTEGNRDLTSEPASDDRYVEAGDEMIGSPDTWELLGEISERLPSEADLPFQKTPAKLGPEDLDLLGDIVNRAPSEMDRMVGESVKSPPIMRGDAPTARDIDRLEKRRSSGKIVQFVPRQAQPTSDEIDPGYEILNELEQTGSEAVDNVITQFPVDLVTRESVTSTIQELLFCANVGEFMHGFALYTDKFLFKFMDDSGMNEDEFRERFNNVPPKDPAEWTRIDSIKEFRRMEDGRVAASVRYIDGNQLDGTERFVFKLDPATTRWLIDDIQAAD